MSNFDYKVRNLYKKIGLIESADDIESYNKVKNHIHESMKDIVDNLGPCELVCDNINESATDAEKIDIAIDEFFKSNEERGINLISESANDEFIIET